jgi:hypothetical protein
VLGYTVATSLAPREAETFAPTDHATTRPPRLGAVDTLTVDTRDTDHWEFVDLDQGRWLPAGRSEGWDIAVRRFHVIAAVAVADGGPTPFDSLASLPGDRYIRNTAGRDTVNAAIARWYSYSMMSHLLTPNGHVYLVRTTAGRVVKFEPLSYYCPGLDGGCFTFRYGLVAEVPAAP